VFDRLVFVSSTYRYASTSNLLTSSSLRDLITEVGKSHLERGFMVICFQHVSRPYIATQRCRCHDNWYTRRMSIPVLSYLGQLLADFLRPRRLGTQLSPDVLNPPRARLE